ncbi:dmX-like protein 1 isoform X4 [Epinephelus fuscoguttatus]|uniref:dmX-like protein 1 isoform X4 n=1 Tax=Epinephelus fuscoguttatus TaxID=293821 RepID=UPI0020D1D27A|nr:dmX-like protein 1 isoform X4 [Epinephelus fuscoguttatus]
MNLHQVLTGAVNPGDNCFSVGSVNNVPFTAYASGCDVVILGSNFERLQIIPGAKHGNIQVGCVDCSSQGGQIAASYGSIVCVFEPVQLSDQKDTSLTKLNCQWQKTGQFVLRSMVRNLAWHPTGSTLLTGSSSLQLWSNVDGVKDEAKEAGKETGMTIRDSRSTWSCIWQSKTASPVSLMKFSPDGEFFATAGQDDCLVKVWYSTSKWKSSVSRLFTPPEPSVSFQGELAFSFVYLAHPRSVAGFTWRKTSKYMPRGAVCNVLLTCCKDSVCRLWAETLLPGDSLLSGYHNNHAPGQHGEAPRCAGPSRKDTCNGKSHGRSAQELNFQESLLGSFYRDVPQPSLTSSLPHHQGRHYSHKRSSSSMPHANALCHFHIAASINPATDIPLLPSISSLSAVDDEEPGGPFTVHWLNNKELHFTLAMEVFLQQLRGSLEQQNECSNEEPEDEDNFDEEDNNSRPSGSQGPEAVELPLAAVKHQVDVLLEEWNKGADMLFSIHPMDGSLLVWHVDWLDEYQPGMFRQTQVSFVSRIPVAFPTGDAISLSHSVVMYACNKNVDLAIQHGRQRPPGSTLPQTKSALISYAGQGKAAPSSSLRLSIFTPNVLMISKHADGSLNQWAVSFAEDSAFSTVLSVSHKSRYCGHRFHLNDLACHSLLPLLLTTSHHNALRTPEADSILAPPDAYSSGFSQSASMPRGSRPSRVSLGVVSQDPNAIYSELILWRVDPVGPLSLSGGVSELARINSLHASAFANIAWLPMLIPSSCLGVYCNSPSACFVASDGHSLRLYQAVIEAKKLLSELSNPEISKFVGEVFNIISQQSTAKPGCIIELDAITDFQGKETQLLHVFEEDLILGKERTESAQETPASPHTASSEAAFSARFFLVVVELTPTGRSLLHMWHLHLAARPITMEETTTEKDTTASASPLNSSTFSFDTFSSPVTQKSKPCTSNLQSACRLSLTTHRLYSQELTLPDGVEAISVTPSAGHLSASCSLPADRVPYLIATSCSDEKVRFWRCNVIATEPFSMDNLVYQWEEWPLLVEESTPNSSAVSVQGRPIEVSCCHSGRIAVAYRQMPNTPLNSTPYLNSHGLLTSPPTLASSPHVLYNSNNHHQTPTLTVQRSPNLTPIPNLANTREPLVHIGIFQCESTGGSQWILEQTIVLDSTDPSTGNANIQSDMDSPIPNEYCPGSAGKSLVHLDWVSQEGGSHVLTVGIGTKIYMYGRLIGKPPELGLSSDASRDQSLSRLVLLRSVDLVSSVEGSLPIPVSLSWVRDGILVVGMDCEMHVYSQWQPPAPSKPNAAIAQDTDISSSVSSIISAVRQSQEDGLSAAAPTSSLAPPKRALTRSMMSLAQKLSGKRTAYDLPVEMEDSGLFEAAHQLFPTLPQYHPVQLLELMDLGKVHRAKAILSHLVKCIAGEIVTLKDNTTNPEKRLRSRTISAGGSTARDRKMFSKAEKSTTDYTEISSIPPLPLYALLAADEDTSPKPDKVGSVSGDSGHGSTHADVYDELFHTPSIADLDPLDDDQEEMGNKVIDLSQYSPTYFGPEHAQVLSSHLLHSSLPGLTRMEQMSLMALADTIATTSTDLTDSQGKSKAGGETLDECGLKFLLAVRLHTFLSTSLPPAHRAQLLRQGLSTCHYAWAFHSEAEEELLNMLPALQKGEPTWPELRSMGVGWWLRSTNKLRRCIEKVAKASLQRNNDPLDAAIFYLALKKKAVVWGLYRSQKNAKMTEFFRNNFSEDRWRKAALKNAFSLLGKQRFQHSAAFFLLAGSLKDAVEVCIEKMQDLQLALVISRLYESEFETSSTYKKILQRHVLGQDKQIHAHQDPFLRSMAHWVLEDYSRALDTLLEQPANSTSSRSTESKCDAGSSYVSACNPEVFNFYTYLRTHPLLLRRHFGSSDKAKVGLTAEGRRADSISLEERRLFFTAAYAHLQAGCPMLSLEVLSKMPKVRKHSKPPNQDGRGIASELSVGSKTGQTSDPDWSQPALNGYESDGNSLSNSHSDSVLSFDWSQPSLQLPDEPLELKWDSEKEEEEDDEEEEEAKNGKSGRAADSNSVFQDTQDAMSPLMETVTGEDSEDCNDFIAPSDDILAAQLKFTACLKIMTNELRTLSTGYELDGGKLRYQLYQWLEREVVALQCCCSYRPCLPELSVQGDAPVSGLVEEEQPGSPRSDSQRRRRHWLQSNQPLLRMFLSYCSLHGSHGGGLASVRMELILLLQESHQDDSILSAVTPCCQPTSIPLLMACTANVKTVVANPIVYLTNLAHDILQTINSLDSPPHPDVVNNEIYVMHTLAASLSASIYQCLCDGHTQSHVNHFTGIVYQSVLLSQKHPVKTVSMDESVQPNTSPAQWPGIASLIRMLSSAGEESQPGLAVLLCEILTAVFLSLFVHGMATHSSNELFRIVAHPLNSKLWVTVFGGGARTPVIEKPNSPIRATPPASPSGTERKSRRFRLLSSRSGSKDESGLEREGPLSPKHGPVVEQGATSVFKEQFVPPELSIWDYFITKPSLPPSESRIEYDSEESQGSEDEEEDDSECEDVFDPSSPQREHSNHNSYSWCLMRLAMVQLVLVNLKSFYPMAGYDLLDLPVGSPLCHAVLKTLQRWEQVLQKRLEIFGGPPSKYIATPLQDETTAPGPALLRHKALFEPSNTPFRTSHHSALPVKRLWQFLVKQEEVQETFIRNIFTKKRDPNETESDLGSPGGKARIIHKESDIITAFAINKANRNCLVMASTHDIQELDVSSILATQILTWIDDDDAEAKGVGDDFLVVHTRDDFAALHGTTPYTHSSPGTPINMPWLGGVQTGRGAAVMIKRNINNVRRMTSHPTLPYYLTGAQDGSVRMFEWGHSQQIICFRSPGNSRVTRIRFNHQGNKFGIVDADGGLSLWQTNTSGNAPKPYLTLQCHNKTAHDFVFVGSSSLIATAGLSTDNRNVCLWDTLVTPANSLVHAFCCHDSGATVLAMAPRQQLLVTGGRKGWISILELAHRHQRQSFQAHDSPVKALAVDPTEDCFISGSAEGNIKIWSLATQCPLYTFPNEHARQSLFRNLGTGVMQIEVGPASHIFSCGADGTMKMRILPNRFSVVNNNNNNHGNLKNDVKFII